jgi:hypothetical protein
LFSLLYLPTGSASRRFSGPSSPARSKLVDRDEAMTHPEFRQKLEAVGYGVFVPVSSSRPALGSSLACATRRASRGVRFRWRSGAFGI